jgi:repressor LexA
MTGQDLTERQKEVLAFIKDFIAEAGYPPSFREICARFGIKSPKNAGKHLKALERKGFIRRASGASRAMEVVDRPFRDAVSLPIAGRIRAGRPEIAIEDIAGRVVLDGAFFKCRDAFLLRVDGDSMKGAGIEDGDYLIVRPLKDAANGDIVVALLAGEATVKRFFREGGAVMLRPENPAVDPIRVEEGAAFEVIGRVIYVIKRMEGA